MYTIHAYFPPKTYEKEHPDRVWVKRMIPCVCSFMKRRRTKDYAKLLEILVKEAQKLGYKLEPSQAIIERNKIIRSKRHAKIERNFI